MNAETRKTGTLTGFHVLAVILFFFASVIGVNAYFIVQALKSFPGEDEAKSYAQGLRFNATLADRAQQSALGWRAEVSLAPAADGAHLEVRLVDPNGAPLDGLAVTGALRRPVDAREDHSLTFVAKGRGLYAAKLTSLATGQWTLHAEARGAQGHFEIAKRLLWQTLAP